MTAKIFLTSCAGANRRKGTGVKALLLEIPVFHGQLSTLLGGKDKVYVLGFCHSRNNWCPAGFF